MANKTDADQPWLGRFAARGGFNLCLTVLAAVLICPSVHRHWGLDWFYAILAGGFISVVLAHIVLAPVAWITLRIFSPASLCGVCPVCGERSLAARMRISEPTADPRLRRVYTEANCRRCHRYFHLFDDGTHEEVPCFNTLAEMMRSAREMSRSGEIQQSPHSVHRPRRDSRPD